MKLPSGKQWEIMDILGSSEMTGLEINAAYERNYGSPMSLGTLYVTLGRMKAAGWVLAKEDSDEDGRFRHYQLSGEGYRVMQATYLFHGAMLGGAT